LLVFRAKLEYLAVLHLWNNRSTLLHEVGRDLLQLLADPEPALTQRLCPILRHEGSFVIEKIMAVSPGVRLAVRLTRNIYLKVGTEYIARKNIRTRPECRPF
jgi:hypothetical protein